MADAQPWPRILLVDDEAAIVSVISRRLERESLHVTAMTDPRLAADALQEQHFALILSDNRMPQMSGIELLQIAKKRSPQTRRILLTGFTNKDDAIEALNNRTIHQFLEKPWKNDKLLVIVREQLALYTNADVQDAARRDLKLRLHTNRLQLQSAMSVIQQATEEFGDLTQESSVQRLAAVVMADIVGYSALMHRNPETTLRNLTKCREIWHDLIASHGGFLVNEPGDSVLVTFDSAGAAIRCAVGVQHALQEFNRDLPEADQTRYRIGVTVGEVIEQAGAIYGDGVNIAARLQAMAAPDEIWLSQSVYEYLRNMRLPAVDFMGKQRLHNISEPVGAYRIRI